MSEEAKTGGAEQGVYFGIDLSEKNTLVSYYQLNMEEPETVSTVLGSEVYTMPTAMAKRLDANQWYIGTEARQMVNLGKAAECDDLYATAKADGMLKTAGETMRARDLLCIYIRKLLEATGRFYNQAPLLKLVFTVEATDANVAEMFAEVAKALELKSTQWMVIDHRQSFYYYAFSQADYSLCRGDIMLYDFNDRHLHSCLMTHRDDTRPKTVDMITINQGSILTDKDAAFDEIVSRTTEGHTISAVYLTGDGFDGQWMKASLQRLCSNRRVFMGKNLYAKGACYAGAVRDKKRQWDYIYMGDQEMKMSISLKVLESNRPTMLSLITAGDSWYNARGECEVILDGKPQVTFYVQPPQGHQAKTEELELKDMPLRPTRTTRLRIAAIPTSDRKVTVTVKDLGFGEIYQSSGLCWEYEISCDDMADPSDSVKELRV